MKTKVIAFRVTEREYEVLQFAAAQAGLKLAEFVNREMMPSVAMSYEIEKSHQRKMQARAKRDAKKAATDVVQ